MKIFGYGEDALTFWAINNLLPVILKTLDDPSVSSKCQIFFRPSFGRRGGNNRAEFGEFDFIILAEHRLYIGESKWDRSSEKIQGGILNLRDEQILRHNLFKFYVEEWAFGSYANWSEFERKGKEKLRSFGISKPIASLNSRLATNLKTVLSIIREHYPALPDIINVLLYLHNQRIPDKIPKRAGEDFRVVAIDYSGSVIGGFISITL